MTKGLHISIRPETIFEIYGFHVTNSYLAALVVLILFACLAVYYSSQIKKNRKSLFFYLIHYVIKSLYDFFNGVLKGDLDRFFPLLGSLFMYILLLNWFGLLPGVGSVLIGVEEAGEHVMAPLFRGTTSDLNTTLALALISFIVIEYNGVRYLGFKGYSQKFFSSFNPMSIFIGLLEIISEFSRIVSFSFRLFGNIFAGEVIIAVMSFLIPSYLSFIVLPFFLMETFVGFIQALVFTMLTAVFVKLAITKAHH